MRVIKVITVLSSLVILTGCIKSAEVRTAEGRLENYVQTEGNKYRSACESEAARHVPVNMQYFRPDPPTLQNCGMYSGAAAMICENGNQNSIRMNQMMATRQYDANAKQRQKFVETCIAQILSQDSNFVFRKSQLETDVRRAEAKQPDNPLKSLFGM